MILEFDNEHCEKLSDTLCTIVYTDKEQSFIFVFQIHILFTWLECGGKCKKQRWFVFVFLDKNGTLFSEIMKTMKYFAIGTNQLIH